MAGGGGQITAFTAFTAFPPPVEKTVSRLEWRDDLRGTIPHPGSNSRIFQPPTSVNRNAAGLSVYRHLEKETQSVGAQEVAVLSVNGWHKRKRKCRGPEEPARALFARVSQRISKSPAPSTKSRQISSRGEQVVSRRTNFRTSARWM